MSVVSASWHLRVETFQKEHLTAGAAAHSLALDRYQALIVEHFTRLFRECEVRARTRPDGLLRFLQEGRWRTRFDLLVTEPEATVEEWHHNRARTEAAMFTTCSEDMNPVGRPAYGYLFDREEPPQSEDAFEELMRLEGYGRVVLVFKPELKAETTFVFGDSIVVTDSGQLPTVSPASAVSPHHLPIDHSSTNPLSIGRVCEYAQPDGWTYVEAQLHTHLTPDDLVQVVSLGADTTSDAARQLEEARDLLESRGVPIEFEGVG